MYCTLRSSTRPQWFCYILTKSNCRSRHLTDRTPPAAHQCAGDRRTWWRVWRNVRTGRVRSGSDYTAAGERERETSTTFLLWDLLCSAHQEDQNWTQGLKMCCCAKASTGVKELVTGKFLPQSFILESFFFFFLNWGFEQCWQSWSDLRGLAWHDMKQRFHGVCQI